MRPEEVPDGAVAYFMAAVMQTGQPCEITTQAIRAGIAAVAPLIQAEALERAAVWHDKQAETEEKLAENAAYADERSTFAYHRRAAATHTKSAAAIRALKETTT